MRPNRVWIVPIFAACLVLVALASAGVAFGASGREGVFSTSHDGPQAPLGVPQLDFFLTGTTDLSYNG